ncbi:MAG TPA: septal ring lytic transglycosylase RlpA family protein [Terriglobales bacterium]|jgi:rare lipoprotein A
MRGCIAQGVAAIVLVANLGAAQGPSASSGSKSQIKPIPQQVVLTPVSVKSHPKPFQVGFASWYGSYFQGKDTASGEPYNMYDLTAAHPSLPLGTMVKVTNLRNGRSIIVKVNDRGPVVPGRIIDLSYNAARALNFKNKGLAHVRLDVVHPQVLAEMRAPLAY